MARFSLGVLITLLLSACSLFQERVTANTTVFYASDFKVGGSIAVVAADEKLSQSLEFAHYQQLFQKKLQAAGFAVETDPAKATYIALVAYGIDHGETTVLSRPIYGVVAGGYYAADNVYIMPSYGVVDVSSSTVTNYTRALAMDIVLASSFKTSQVKKVYETRTKSVGECSVMLEVFDEMLDAMFTGFPAANASNSKLSLPANLNC